MQKNLFSLLIVTAVFCACDLAANGDNENVQKKSINLDGLPDYLREKREEQLVGAFIEQASGKKGAIEEAKRKMFERTKEEAYNQKIKLCYVPGWMEFITWTYRWLPWNWSSESRSDLEVQFKKLDDWHAKTCKEVAALAQEYEKNVGKTDEIRQHACKKLEKAYAANQGALKRIGKFDDNGQIKLLSKPEEKYLKRNESTIPGILFPKILDEFHNQEIPITQKEALDIFQANPIFAKRSVELEQVWNAINAVVGQHEKKMAGLNNISSSNNDNADNVENTQNNLNNLNKKEETNS